MEPHLAEDEELQKIKEWWKNNGSSILIGIGVGIAAIVGINGWKSYTEGRSESASLIYSQLQTAVSLEQKDQAVLFASELRNDFSASAYAFGGALLAAGVAYRGNDVETAREMLQWVLDSETESSLQHTARLRLAYIEIGTGNYNRALELLETDNTSGFESSYAELKADAQLASGNGELAHDLYGEAIASLPGNSGYGHILRAKKNNLARAE